MERRVYDNEKKKWRTTRISQMDIQFENLVNPFNPRHSCSKKGDKVASKRKQIQHTFENCFKSLI